MGHYTNKIENEANKNGSLKCPQCGKGVMKDFEFDDAGFPIFRSPCKVCGYPN